MAKSQNYSECENLCDEELLISIWRNDEIKKPKVIIFDLDFTLWPYFANRYYQPPFKHEKDSNRILDSKNKKVTYFKDVPKILGCLKDQCFQNGEKLAVASRSGDRKTVTALLDALGWSKYFQSIQIYPGNKKRHIQTICDELNIKANSNFLFFDDDPENFSNTTDLGLVTCLVDKNNGLNMKTLINGLKKYDSTVSLKQK